MGGSVGGRTHGKGEGRPSEYGHGPYHGLRRAEGSDFETLRLRRRNIPATVPPSKKESGGDFRGGGTASTRLGEQMDELCGVVQRGFDGEGRSRTSAVAYATSDADSRSGNETQNNEGSVRPSG